MGAIVTRNLVELADRTMMNLPVLAGPTGLKEVVDRMELLIAAEPVDLTGPQAKLEMLDKYLTKT